MRILLVEDDTSLGKTIQAWLEMDGETVDWVRTAEEALLALDGFNYAVALLDRGLPKQAGDVVLTHIRKSTMPTAVLMITARDSISDRVTGLDLGADDYLVKPFDLEELSARIRAAVRKYSEKPTAAVFSHMIDDKALELNPVTKQVALAGTLISLTDKEYIVLHRLMRTPSQVVSKSQIEDDLYGWGDEIESNAIEVYVSHLRKKIGKDSIKTIRNQGYVMAVSG